MKPHVSIVIPAYNEAKRLGSSLEAVNNHLVDQRIKAEVILVDDGSTDATADVAGEIFSRFDKTVRGRVIRYEQNVGKGYAVRTGMLAADGEVTLFSDADLSTPISEMEKLLTPIRNDEADVVFGSRALDRSLIGNHQPWRREQGGKIFNLIVRILAGLPFWDTQCGFKAFRTELFRPLLEVARIDRFGFDVELLVIANFAGLRLMELPVRWNHSEGSKVSVLRDSVRMIKEVREIRRNLRTGEYDRVAELIALKGVAEPQRSLAASA